ncbi:U4/U6 small nuclear ribonucleoprotein Prp31-like protein [Thalictrum thalictroides]|uniref:U4/U6 small nuclear ribonucleoprotein Prp31-like protein n=1 Tax=Thalictrum thalictroides TaxID=46969 RepID=A0A7J6V283_THATH|nr:U4/U6 small nuclear ribonucleoprotein Prp31-like protein [Thalictrum thalictroides]
MVTTLDLAKKKVLDFVETRMRCIAPNLSAIVGSIVAAKLIGIADKSTLAAHVDSSRRCLTGEYGRTLRDEICKKIKNYKSFPLLNNPSLYQFPDFNTKKKRGGRRFRKTKERNAVTEMRKLANRIQFGVQEESSLGDGLGFEANRKQEVEITKRAE